MARRYIALVVAAWLVACGGHSSAPMNLMPPNASQGLAPAAGLSRDSNVNELPEPPVVNSVHGVAKVSLQVTLSGATGFPQFVYQGVGGIAPTIRVNPGDTIDMEVADNLIGRRGGRAEINIHFHGLGSSPRAPGDDVLGTVARPGQTLHYIVHVPKNQEPGLYWYHPHVHGQTTYQVGSGGMSGALVVNGLEKHIPSLAKMKERVIIVRATGTGQNAPPGAKTDGASSDTISDDDDMSDMAGAMPGGSGSVKPQFLNSEPCGSDLGLTTTLNGAYQPVITIAPGEKQFFRVINATGHKTLDLSDGGDLQIVAVDGFALDSWPGTPPTKTVKSIVFPPAARREFVVTGPASGHAVFKTLCYDTGPDGDRDPELKLADMKKPKGKSAPPAAIGPLRVGAPLPQNGYTQPLPPVAHKRTIVFNETPAHFLIDGKAFKMSDPPLFVVHVGTVEEWHVMNVTGEIHDFHLHQAHFLVKEINGVALAHPYWADSFIIPREKNGHPGSLLLIADFRDPIIKGTFLFHCHILDHEDAGMMAKIQAI